MFMNEITSNNTYKTDFNDTSLYSRPCDSKFQQYVIGYGLTNGGAVSDMESGIQTAWQEGDLDCTPLDSTPQMDSIGIFITATTSFCCDGKGGGGGTW